MIHYFRLTAPEDSKLYIGAIFIFIKKKKKEKEKYKIKEREEKT